MKLFVRRAALVAVFLFTGMVVAPQARAAVLGYPTTEQASFLVDIPDGWDVEPGEEEGDFVHVYSPDGVYLAFRTIPGSEGAMEEAISASVDHLEANYKNVTVGEPVDAKQAGLTGFFMDGTGKDEDGTPTVFRMAWLALKDGHIGEIWFAAPADDKAGVAQAAKALNSFRAP